MRASLRPNSSTPSLLNPYTDRDHCPFHDLLGKICDRTLASRAMSNDIAPLAVRARQDLHDHDVTRSG